MAGWREIDERCAVIGGAVNIGVIRLDGDRSLLVDTGLDRDSGRRAVRSVAEAGWGTVEGILTTHAHADHVGGHPEVTRRTGCPVWAPPAEAAVMANPETAPAILFGASAPATMRGKFLLPARSTVDHLVTAESLEVDGLTIGVIPLGGHAPGQVAYRVGDTVFAADVVFPVETLEKHRVPFIHDVTAHRASLEVAAQLDADRFVPGHGDGLDQAAFRALVAANRDLLDHLGELALAAADGASTEQVVAAVLAAREASPRDLAAWSLMAVTVRALLADLLDSGRLEVMVEGGRVTWRAA